MKAACIAGVVLACSGAMAHNGLSCPPEKGAVQAAATETSSCHADKAQAVVQTVSADSKSSCCASEGAAAAVQTVAMDTKACDGGSCDKSATPSTAQIAALDSAMPAFVYVVGENSTHCPVEAGKMASAEHAPIAYEVAGVSFENELDAREAYAAELRGYLDGMTRVSFVVGGEHVYCPMKADALCEKTGEPLQYRVGAVVFDSADKAIRAAAMAYGAAHHVGMSYTIDGKPTSCAKTAAAACESGMQKVSYVVAGKATSCPVQSACNLAIAKIEAAQSAIQKVAGQG